MGGREKFEKVGGLRDGVLEGGGVVGWWLVVGGWWLMAWLVLMSLSLLLPSLVWL